MKRYHLLSFIGIAFLTPMTAVMYAQVDIGTRIDRNSVFLPDNSNLNRDNIVDEETGRNTTIYGGYTSDLNGLFNSSALAGFQNELSIGTLNTLLQSDLFTLFESPLTVSPGTGPFADIDWQTSYSMPENSFPLIFIGTQPLNELTLGSFVGFVGQSSPNVFPENDMIGFTTGDRQWDTPLIGDLGSITLVEIIPEPRVYAALFGVFALGFVLWRRRRA